MTGSDWIVVGLVIVVLLVTAVADRRATRRRRHGERPCQCLWCSQAREHRRDRELGRLP